MDTKDGWIGGWDVTCQGRGERAIMKRGICSTEESDVVYTISRWRERVRIKCDGGRGEENSTIARDGDGYSLRVVFFLEHAGKKPLALGLGVAIGTRVVGSECEVDCWGSEWVDIASVVEVGVQVGGAGAPDLDEVEGSDIEDVDPTFDVLGNFVVSAGVLEGEVGEGTGMKVIKGNLGSHGRGGGSGGEGGDG